MARAVLDTSYLVSYWRQRSRGSLEEVDRKQAESWAQELIRWLNTAAIVTPVYIEFVAGARNAHELSLFKAFVGQFDIVDRGRILAEDWKLAIRLAQRVPADGHPRQLGDCLIRAIARRLKYEVETLDQGFPH